MSATPTKAKAESKTKTKKTTKVSKATTKKDGTVAELSLIHI